MIVDSEVRCGDRQSMQTVLDMRGSIPLSRSMETIRDTIIALIGMIMSPFILTYELIRYLCKKLK